MYIRAGIQLKLITETANETNDDLQHYATLSLRSTLENDGGRNYIMYNSDYPEFAKNLKENLGIIKESWGTFQGHLGAF